MQRPFQGIKRAVYPVNPIIPEILLLSVHDDEDYMIDKIVLDAATVSEYKERSISCESYNPCHPVLTTNPIEGMTSLIEGTTSPIEATTSPIEPTTSPIEPTTSPIEATTTPIEATTTPVEATTTPVEVHQEPS
jgi:hypothetical protein